MDFNFYIVALKHVIGSGGCPNCPILSEKERQEIKAAQGTGRSQTIERGNKKIAFFLKKMCETCGIVQTNHGLKSRADLCDGDIEMSVDQVRKGGNAKGPSARRKEIPTTRKTRPKVMSSAPKPKQMPSARMRKRPHSVDEAPKPQNPKTPKPH